MNLQEVDFSNLRPDQIAALIAIGIGILALLAGMLKKKP